MGTAGDDIRRVPRGDGTIAPVGVILRGPPRPYNRRPRMADLKEIQAMIERALPGAEVEVIDETGGGDHLRAIVTSSSFEGKSRLDQHRMVKAAVQERFDDGQIHALSVKTSLPGR